jgi:trehalose 6-phosphate synthase/phosphatase
MAQNPRSDSRAQLPSLAARDPSRPYSPASSIRSESPAGGRASRAAAAAAAYDATPGINLATYHSPQPDTEDNELGGYFSRDPRAVASSGNPQSQAPLLAQTAAARAASGSHLLKQATIARMGHQSTLDEIRAANPDLAVSGNIISATFNMPHSFNYRKNSDWVGLAPTSSSDTTPSRVRAPFLLALPSRPSSVLRPRC